MNQIPNWYNVNFILNFNTRTENDITVYQNLITFNQGAHTNFV